MTLSEKTPVGTPSDTAQRAIAHAFFTSYTGPARRQEAREIADAIGEFLTSKRAP